VTRRQPPNEAQPVVTRVRIRYGKSGRMRFASHRDFQRALERAVRRAGLPIAMSGGFTPHPRISYANAAPTGAASEAEYVELGLSAPVAADEVAAALNGALPDGFRILAAAEADRTALADQLQASRWRIELPDRSRERIDAAIATMWQRAPVTVPRLTKSGTRDIAVTDNWVAAEADDDGVLRVVVRAATPTVRPDDIVAALGIGPATVCTREAQGPLVAGAVTNAF